MKVTAGPLQFYGFRKASSEMRLMIREGANDPAVIQKAFEIVATVAQGHYFDEARALFEFVRDHIRYTNDVYGEDIYRTPALTLQMKGGDCNNKVVLGCSLAKAIGFPTRMVFVFEKRPGLQDDFPFHVLYQVNVDKGERDDRWIDCETIPVPTGKSSMPQLVPFGQSVPAGFKEFVNVD